MTDKEQAELMRQAREQEPTDPALALQLRRRVADSHRSLAWSEARIEMAAYEVGFSAFESILAYALPVLDAPDEIVAPATRAVAGILVCGAQEDLDRDVDEALLSRSIEAAESAGEPFYAGCGLRQQARLLLRTSNAREAAIATLERAVEQFDKSPSMFAGPRALLELAKLKSENGDVTGARADIERGLERVARYPHAGQSGRMLRDKLLALRDHIAER